RAAVERHRSRCRVERAGEHFEQRGLAGSVGTEDPDELAAIDLERDVVENLMAVTGAGTYRKRSIGKRDVDRPKHGRLLPASRAPKKGVSPVPGFLTRGSARDRKSVV